MLFFEARSEAIGRSSSESRESMDAEVRNERIASVLDRTRPEGCVRSLIIVEYVFSGSRTAISLPPTRPVEDESSKQLKWSPTF